MIDFSQHSAPARIIWKSGYRTAHLLNACAQHYSGTNTLEGGPTVGNCIKMLNPMWWHMIKTALTCVFSCDVDNQWGPRQQRILVNRQPGLPSAPQEPLSQDAAATIDLQQHFKSTHVVVRWGTPPVSPSVEKAALQTDGNPAIIVDAAGSLAADTQSRDPAQRCGEVPAACSCPQLRGQVSGSTVQEDRSPWQALECATPRILRTFSLSWLNSLRVLYPQKTPPTPRQAFLQTPSRPIQNVRFQWLGQWHRPEWRDHRRDERSCVGLHESNPCYLRKRNQRTKAKNGTKSHSSRRCA